MAVATTGSPKTVPLADEAVRGDQHAAALVASGDELDEKVRRVRVEERVAEFVDDRAIGLHLADEVADLPEGWPAIGLSAAASIPSSQADCRSCRNAWT
jgi:hypothetical protein